MSFSGTYCPQGSPAPIGCTPGMYCPTDMMSIPLADCLAGYYCTENSTTSMPSGVGGRLIMEIFCHENHGNTKGCTSSSLS